MHNCKVTLVICGVYISRPWFFFCFLKKKYRDDNFPSNFRVERKSKNVSQTTELYRRDSLDRSSVFFSVDDFIRGKIKKNK